MVTLPVASSAQPVITGGAETGVQAVPLLFRMSNRSMYGEPYILRFDILNSKGTACTPVSAQYVWRAIRNRRGVSAHDGARCHIERDNAVLQGAVFLIHGDRYAERIAGCKCSVTRIVSRNVVGSSRQDDTIDGYGAGGKRTTSAPSVSRSQRR